MTMDISGPEWEAFQKGMEDFQNTARSSDNPYSITEPKLQDAWITGWNHAFTTAKVASERLRRGGPRPGAGRKPLDGTNRSKEQRFYLTPEHDAAFTALGGAVWLRGFLTAHAMKGK